VKAAQARVLLTGANGGIGSLVARGLSGAGARLLVAGRSPARLAALTRELGEDRADWFSGDLAAPAALDALAHQAAGWGCNVVVHAAGVAAFGPAQAATAAHLQQVMATNLAGPMLLTHSLLPHLAAQPRSQVIFIGSVLGAIGLPGYAVYCASKFGLRGYAQALRRELAGGPVRVQYLGPRSTRTAFNGSDVQAYNAATGTAMDAPQRVADALLRLLEDEAPERFTGFPERLAVRLNGALPVLLDGAFERHRKALAGAARNGSLVNPG
jgi:short-subunit dehydrogenase